MATFSRHELYGGAIHAHLPRGYIDASTLRQIPDHQEVFLSPTTLSSLVVELNQSVSVSASASAAGDPAEDPSSVTAAPAPAPDADDNDRDSDRAAALYHLRDLVAPHDSLSAVSTPRRVEMRSESLRGVPAVLVQGRVSTREEEAGRGGFGDATTTTTTTTTTIRLLLVRLQAHSTDLCVLVNVPWKELGEGQVEEEEAFADSVVESLLASLEVRDFGLFDG